MRKMILIAASALAATASTTLPARAQGADGFPNKPITLLCAFPAGGSADIFLRQLGELAGRHLGQPVVIDNKSGGAGTVAAATMAAGARPDGYTIAQLPITVFRLPLMQKVSWDATKDFSYVIHLTGYTLGIAAKADGPFKTWKDVVEYAKVNPGKVSYASSGTGGTPHLATEQIAAKDGIQLLHVPMKGGTESSAALLGGHVMLMADSTTFRPLVDAGQMRILNLWTAERVKGLPDVPILKDLGYDMVFESPYGLAGPKGMDPAIVRKLHDAFKKALEDPGVVATLGKYDKLPRYLSSEDYVKTVPRLIEGERKALERIGLLKKE